jgi:phosphatidylinositol alpha-mannosyltransferase
MANSPKLNVGLVFDDSLDRPDGVAQYVKTLGAWLSGQGHKVSYLVGETKLKNWEGGQVYSLSRNLRVSFNGNKLSMPLPGNAKRIEELLQKQKFDVLHVMVPYSPFMAAKVINKAPRTTAIIGTFHIFPSGRISVWGSKALRIILWRSLKRFSQIVSVSPASAEFAHEIFGIKRGVVPNPVKIKDYQSNDPRSINKNEIVFLGRLVKRKGAAQLVDAFYELSKQNHEARLTVAGDGPERGILESKVKDLGLKDKINFLGYIPETTKQKLLRSAAIACFPSLYGEAFGIVLIEAMAAGALVLGGDNPGYRSVLGGQPQLLVDPNDTKAFAARLDLMLKDQKKRSQTLTWQAKEIWKYDINVVGGQIINAYDSAIARLDKKSHNNNHE